MVVVAVVAEKFVVVAFVPVAFTNVKSCNVEDPEVRKFVAVTRPPLPIENNEEPAELKMLKRFADCPEVPRTRRGTAVDEVASTVRTVFEAGEVVPIEDWPEPDIAAAFCANATEDIRCRGDNVSEDKLFDETSTCRYTSSASKL